jgi:hypothetical protein
MEHLLKLFTIIENENGGGNITISYKNLHVEFTQDLNRTGGNYKATYPKDVLYRMKPWYTDSWGWLYTEKSLKEHKDSDTVYSHSIVELIDYIHFCTTIEYTQKHTVQISCDSLYWIFHDITHALYDVKTSPHDEAKFKHFASGREEARRIQLSRDIMIGLGLYFDEKWFDDAALKYLIENKKKLHRTKMVSRHQDISEDEWQKLAWGF